MDEPRKSYKVRVSPRAAHMLAEHAAFLAGVSRPAAVRLRTSFRESAASLIHFPERCPYLRDEVLPSSKYRKLIFEDTYLILYEVVGDTVLIQYVVDCRADYGWLLDRG